MCIGWRRSTTSSTFSSSCRFWAILSAPIVAPRQHPQSHAERGGKRRRARDGRLVNITRQRLRGIALALGAGAAIATAPAAERDVLGWEGARWGMSESEIKEAFSSKLLVPLAGAQPGETVLSTPGYVFLGCPFDVSFRFMGSRGLIRIDLTQVGNFVGHYGNGTTGYEAGCKLLNRRLQDKLGPAQARGAESAWTFPSTDVTSGGTDIGQVYVTLARHLDAKQRS